MAREDGQFKKGHSGRKKGSRNKITKAYLAALAKDFAEHGSEVIVQVRESKPEVYMKQVGSLVPKDLDIKHSGDVTVQLVNYADESKDED